MEEWKRVSLLLCTFGFVRELRPSEPYVSEFLLGPWRNITEQQLNKQVYPISTYSYLALLVIVFLVTDYLRYKPLIVLSGLCGILINAILLWTESLEWLQVSQLLFGLYMATEVAYYTYMFAKVDEEHYRQVSSWSRSSALLGKFLAGAMAQLLVSLHLMDYRQLNYITLTTQVVCSIWSLLLPSVSRSIYFHREQELPLKVDPASSPPPQRGRLALLWEHAVSAFSNPYVLGWSLWYAASLALYLQAQCYIQLMWKETDPKDGNLYNGNMKAVTTVLGAVAALTAVRAPRGWSLVLLAAAASALQAISAFCIADAKQVWSSYAGYVTLSVVYQYMVTTTSSEIARNLVYSNCFGLIFGINTLLALVFQTVLTLAVVSETGLALSIRNQYRVYAGGFILISAISLVAWTSRAIVKYGRTKPAEQGKEQEMVALKDDKT